MSRYKGRSNVGTSSQQREAEEVRYHATAEDWKSFLLSKGWQDLKTFLEVSKEDGKELLSMEPEERAIAASDDTLRGGIRMLRRVLAFPREQLEELENDRGRDDTSWGDSGS